MDSMSAGGCPAMKIILANPRGFCAGVNMAIESLERALEFFGAPLYVYHEIVHNKYVVERFLRRGTVFVESLEDVPEGWFPVAPPRFGRPSHPATQPPFPWLPPPPPGPWIAPPPDQPADPRVDGPAPGAADDPPPGTP